MAGLFSCPDAGPKNSQVLVGLTMSGKPITRAELAQRLAGEQLLHRSAHARVLRLDGQGRIGLDVELGERAPRC